MILAFKKLFLLSVLSLMSMDVWSANALQVPSNSKMLSVQNGYLLLRGKQNQLLLGRLKDERKFVLIDDSAHQFSGAQVSENGRRLLSFYKFDSDSGYFKIFELPSGKLLVESKKIQNLEGAFWGSACNYYVHTGAAENGGVVKVFADTTNSECRAVAPKTDSKVLSKDVPVYFWQDSHFNNWAFYKNGSRALLNWIGKGSFDSFQASKFPYIWFQEATYQGLLFRGDLSSKKIQPLSAFESFASRGDKAIAYGISKGQVVELSLKADFQLKRRELARVGGATQIWWDESMDLLVVENSENRYFTVKP